MGELPCFCCASQQICLLSDIFLVIVREMAGSVSRNLKSTVCDGIEDSSRGGEGGRNQQKSKSRTRE